VACLLETLVGPKYPEGFLLDFLALADLNETIKNTEAFGGSKPESTMHQRNLEIQPTSWVLQIAFCRVSRSVIRVAKRD
jgi:hypothetical protein